MSQNLSPQRLNHAGATVRVSVTGLAVSCYNPGNTSTGTVPKWEVGLIRHPKHTLRILVNKFDPVTRKGTAIIRELGPSDKISITVQNPILPANALFTRDPFDRMNPGASHPEDLRWIVDFEKEPQFNNGTRLNLTPPPHEVTELYVDAPFLYADPDDKRHELTLLNLANGNEIPFGTLGETCKADVTCAATGRVTLSIEGPEELEDFPIDFTPVPGRTHVIRIENECLDDNTETLGGDPAEPPTPTDFSLYFPFLNLRGGESWDVMGPEGQLGTDAVCNPSFLGVRGSLLPLETE